ncbi:snare associated protein [Cystoisospora suis]|uniref:Snare associated protein n=1 Tax=Cystoisospora suis TaxID=483139 RepID=A0A2C6KYE1_9APIC|nr:snare associated protein [Cystoisospora suis]
MLNNPSADEFTSWFCLVVKCNPSLGRLLSHDFSLFLLIVQESNMLIRNGVDIMETYSGEQSDVEKGDTTLDPSPSSSILFSTSYDQQASLSQSLLERRDEKRGDTGGGEEAGRGGGEDPGERGRSSDHLTSHPHSPMMTGHDGERGNSNSSAFFTFILISKIFIALLLAVVLISALTHLEAVGRVVKAVLAKVEALGYLSPLAFIIAYILLVTLFVPAEALNVAGGLIFVRLYGPLIGMALAFACSMIALSIAGVVCFAMSRYVFSRSMENLFSGNTVYYAFQQAVEEGGTFFVALIRLSPILPYSITSYLFGLTALKLPQLLLGSLSSAPLVFLFNCIGAALRNIDEIDFSRLHWSWEKSLLGAFGVLMALVSLIYISALTRKKLDEASSTARPRRRTRIHIRGEDETITATSDGGVLTERLHVSQEGESSFIQSA